MESLIKFKKFIDELSSNNSRNYKITVLEKYKDDEDIKYYLNYIYNPYIVTGISTKKIDRMKGVDCYSSDFKAICFNNVKELLEYIKVNNTGKDVVLANIEAFKIFYFSPSYEEECKLYVELEDLFNKIITKNLPLGIDAKTINKVMPRLIPTFNVQLANKYFEKPEIVEGKEFALTTKIDGMRCIMMKENGEVTFWSRQGQPIEGLVDLIAEAKWFPDNIALDGELIAKETTKEDTYKNTMKTARTKDAEKHNLKMMVFDYMPVQDFKDQCCDISYNRRRGMLVRTFLYGLNGDKFSNYIAKKYPAGLPDCSNREKVEELYRRDIIDFANSTGYNYFNLLPVLYEGNDTSKIEEILKEQVAKGEEGIMINICDALYDFKRTNNLLKCKLFSDTEVLITGFECGTNKNSNTLGNLICDYKGNELRVGSGFADEERNYIWTHQDEYLNKFAKVKYFEETKNANGGVSLRFPTYLGLRLKGDM